VVKVKRTQQQRRESTKARLVDAAIATLSERGYARTTTALVLEDAQVSVGGMYRHYPTLLDLVIAAAGEIRDRQFAEFAAGLSMVGTLTEEECIELLRAACRKPINAAWYDLQVNARTDVELRKRLMPFTEQYHEAILTFARGLEVAQGWDPDAYVVAILSLVHMLDGEAISAVVYDQTTFEKQRTAMMAALLRGEPIPGAPRQPVRRGQTATR